MNQPNGNSNAPKNTVQISGLVSEDGENGILTYQTPLVAVQLVIPIAQIGRVEKVLDQIKAKARSMVVVPGSGPQAATDE